MTGSFVDERGVAQPTKRRVYVMFDNKRDAYHWKIGLQNVKADMPNPPSRDTGDVIEGIFSIKKTNEIEVQNPTKAVNKEEHLKKGERLKSEREKAITGAKKKVRPCGFCKVKTNEHTKTTCPLNPKARKKRKASPVTDV
ncbi:hypothetical protein Tco_1441012 [Tanacetum coccineum]